MQLVLQERWAEIRDRRDEFLAATDVADLARIHSEISVAYFWTAKRPEDWQVAIHHARMGLHYAEPGSVRSVFLLHNLAGLLLLTGRLVEAKRLAQQFLEGARHRDKLQPFVPLTLRDLALIAYYERRWDVAVRYASQAAAGHLAAGQTKDAFRAQILVCWCHIRSGRYRRAKLALPSEVPAEWSYLLDGVVAALHAAEGRLTEAQLVGRRALSAVRVGTDSVDAAEVALVLAAVARKQQNPREAHNLVREADNYAALQDWNAYTLLVLSKRAGGGDPSDSSYASRSGNLRLNDACYTTGIA